MRSPALTVDVIIEFPDGSIVLIERGHEPYKGRLALPGGFVEYGERVEEAAVREAREETGLEIRLDRLVGVYSDPARDPRGHTVSVVYHAEPIGGVLAGGDDAARAVRTRAYLGRPLAFDHARILRDAFGDRRADGTPEA
ncbi:MAG TPA: NUDIX hydrolase [candidate division Zixibacteria bacterium]|nr:NUDIX hydrolase [candidate division Zixibacteria bacterium]MDD4917426.1 NUDIX hydrolase [candidate division Zixibacteria bacterium]MDM7972984.1 NUDIX hydrolase [candidate division Zixibacteria bacterium]HOD67545.1 NUDIX hydrolase [candidate division Zixibacteria bacterium]HPI33168.1 NUDIX hydrolase [candidate division Zixibacteria bacterium]